MKPSCFPFLALGLMAASALQAQSFGVQLGATWPQETLKTDLGSHAVFSGGAFLFFDEFDGNVFKPRLDVSSSHRQANYQRGAVGDGHALKLDTASLGFDYNYYFSQKGGEGWYLLLGGQVNYARSNWEAPVTPLKANRTSGAFSIGFGSVVIPHLGFEVRYTGGGKYTNFTKNDSGAWIENRASMAGLSASVVFLF